MTSQILADFLMVKGLLSGNNKKRDILPHHQSDAGLIIRASGPGGQEGHRDGPG